MFHLNHRYWFLGLHPAIKSVATLSRVQYNTIYIIYTYTYILRCLFHPHRSAIDVLYKQNTIGRPQVCFYATAKISYLAVSLLNLSSYLSRPISPGTWPERSLSPVQVESHIILGIGSPCRFWEIKNKK